jgi:hypothetical protein
VWKSGVEVLKNQEVCAGIIDSDVVIKRKNSEIISKKYK